MKHFKKIYATSIIDMLSSYVTYIYLSIFLVCGILFIGVIPKTAMRSFDGGITTTICYIIPIFAFFSSLMAEGNVDKRELTYILSRPVTKQSFFLAKLLSSLTLIVAIYVLIIPIFFISRELAPIPSDETDTVKPVDITKLIFGIFCTVIAVNVIGSSLKFYMKDKITSIFSFVLMFVACVCIAAIVSQTSTNYDEIEKNIIWSLIILLPMCVLLPLSAVICGASYFFITKGDIKI
ncbi:MAG: hypothetical protein LBQ45_01305 [Mycoplasmataceae bacterium]|jgi:hypothetical protein|nr:hypothetical protein [Mycoplasmataceae bacterium]